MARILVIDQDVPFAQLLAEILREHGHAADACADVETALERVMSGDVDVVVLEWTNTNATRGDVCRSMRAAAPGVRIVAMSARQDDHAIALGAGADDHLVKPFSTTRLEARVMALVRDFAPAARRGAQAGGRVAYGRLEIDQASRRVWVDCVERRLSRTQYRLLIAMLAKPGAPVERGVLAREALGAGTHVTANCLDQHVRGLRRALGPARSLVKTCRGFGYGVEVA